MKPFKIKENPMPGDKVYCRFVIDARNSQDGKRCADNGCLYYDTIREVGRYAWFLLNNSPSLCGSKPTTWINGKGPEKRFEGYEHSWVMDVEGDWRKFESLTITWPNIKDDEPREKTVVASGPVSLDDMMLIV